MAGVAPIEPREKVHLGEGVGLIVMVGEGLVEVDIDGDGVGVGVTEEVSEGPGRGLIVCKGVGITNGVGELQDDPLAPELSVQDLTVQRTAREQSWVAKAKEGRQMFGHGGAHMNPLSGAPEHILTTQGGLRIAQSC